MKIYNILFGAVLFAIGVAIVFGMAYIAIGGR